MRPAIVLCAAVAVAAGVALVGCAPPHAPRAVGPSGSRLHVAQIGRVQPGTDDPIRVIAVPTPPPNEAEWQVAHLDPRSRQVHIQWGDGPTAECGRDDQVLVHESTHAVVIGLHSTYSGPDVLCAAAAVLRSRTITLAAPLGTRSLLEYVPTDVNADYSPVDDPDRLPLPEHCLRGSAERNAPVGALEVGARMVPFTPTRALICSVDPRVPERLLTSTTALAALARDLNAGRVLPLGPNGSPTSCPDDRTVFLDLFLSNASAVVQVHLGDRGCLAMSNGVRTTTVPDRLTERLRRLVGSDDRGSDISSNSDRGRSAP